MGLIIIWAACFISGVIYEVHGRKNKATFFYLVSLVVAILNFLK